MPILIETFTEAVSYDSSGKLCSSLKRLQEVDSAPWDQVRAASFLVALAIKTLGICGVLIVSGAAIRLNGNSFILPVLPVL